MRQRTEIVLQLTHAGGTDQGRGHPLVAEHPGQRHLGQGLAAAAGNLVEPADPPEGLLVEPVGVERGVLRGPGVRRDALEVAVGEQALAERGEGDAAHPLLLQLVEQTGLDPPVEHVVRGLVDQQRGAEVRGDPGGLGRLRRGVRGDTDIKGPAGPDRLVEGHHGLLDRGLRVEAVAVEDVDVVQPEPLQRLVQRGQHVLARAAALAVRAGPHVPAGLGGDDQLVAIGLEVGTQELPEIDLRGPVRRAVVVGQVEVGDPGVERAVQDLALLPQQVQVTEVVPQTQRENGQLQPPRADPSIHHRAGAIGVVSVLGSDVRGSGEHHGAHCARYL
ncbi:hypothetical protein SDC9_90636 [bioreactor metagenome]|uniref:Uncharacterized protein n=1 Tax=bioreactor metagenome TaxID=1076179 RepID=A0A644ZU74_9ZZZZ